MNGYARAVLITSILFSVLAVLLTCARVWARRLTRRSLLANDYIIIANTIITFSLCVASEWGAVHVGIGEPRTKLTAKQAVAFRKFLWSAEIIVTFIIGTVKIGVLLFYKQVFATKPRFNLAANVLVGACGIWTVVFVLLIVFKRFPVHNEWSLAANVPHHWNAGAMWTAMSASDILLDLCILTLPFPVLSSLKLGRKRKIQVGAIFCLGAFVAIGSAVRLVYFIRAEPIYGDPYYNFSDSVTNVVIWSLVEACFSLIAANLPLLAPLFKKGQGLRSLLHYGSKHHQAYDNVSDQTGSPELHAKQPKQFQTISMHHIPNRSLDRYESV
ncbi:integral membrane protein pth11 protein [Apiospora arundinis]|uniref:Integral membrane protein pth11 protein n=1 Tax=Apiospora arundinis TaxID=335852 RepID=A0ABR2IGV9_9PEZI